MGDQVTRGSSIGGEWVPRRLGKAESFRSLFGPLAEEQDIDVVDKIRRDQETQDMITRVMQIQEKLQLMDFRMKQSGLWEYWMQIPVQTKLTTARIMCKLD